MSCSLGLSQGIKSNMTNLQVFSSVINLGETISLTSEGC